MVISDKALPIAYRMKLNLNPGETSEHLDRPVGSEMDRLSRQDVRPSSLFISSPTPNNSPPLTNTN